jgi:hypothetical protein
MSSDNPADMTLGELLAPPASPIDRRRASWRAHSGVAQRTGRAVPGTGRPLDEGKAS